MTDPIHGDGIFECEGCGKTYPEYVNGCVVDHPRPRKVVLVIRELPKTNSEKDTT